MRLARRFIIAGLCGVAFGTVSVSTTADAQSAGANLAAARARAAATFATRWQRWRQSRWPMQPPAPPEAPPTQPEPTEPAPLCADADDLLLPDMFVDEKTLADHHLSSQCDGLPGVERCVRISVGTVNAGRGDLILTAPVGHQDQITEHVETCGGEPQLVPVASAFVDEPTHQHLHLQDWTELRLRRIDESCATEETATQCPVVGLGHKVSFCLTDSARYDAVLGRYGGRLYCGVDQGGSRIVQGISSGWMDVYGSGLPGQLIDVTNLESGDYWLEVEVNPHGAVLESRYDNNVTRLRTTLTMPVCGDGVLAPTEECDASSAAALPQCVGLGRGFSGGVASCNATCRLDTTTCERVTCPTASLGSAIGAAVATGSVPTGSGAFSGELCGLGGAQSGGEVTYLWTAPAAGTYAFDTIGSNYDTLLYLLGPSCEARPNVRETCNDDIEDADGVTSRVSLRMQRGEQVVVVVDAYAAGTTGRYVLNVSQVDDPLSPPQPPPPPLPIGE